VTALTMETSAAAVEAGRRVAWARLYAVRDRLAAFTGAPFPVEEVEGVLAGLLELVDPASPYSVAARWDAWAKDTLAAAQTWVDGCRELETELDQVQAERDRLRQAYDDLLDIVARHPALNPTSGTGWPT
jgi:hypothetical protein